VLSLSLLWVVVVVVVASARCSFLSSVVAEEERTWTGEQCDTRRAKTHARIKKRARFIFSSVGKEIITDDASTATTNVQPSRARNDEENRFLLPRDGKDGERSSSERSR